MANDNKEDLELKTLSEENMILRQECEKMHSRVRDLEDELAMLQDVNTKLVNKNTYNQGRIDGYEFVFHHMNPQM